MSSKYEVDIVKNDAKDYSVVCIQCHNTFEATRSDAAFCSVRCRMRHSRAPGQRANYIEYLETEGRDVISKASKYKHYDDVYQAMLLLQNKLKEALMQFEDK